MKKLSVFCATMFVLSISAEVFAQTRGPRYNPGGGGGSSRSSGGGGSSSSGGSRSSGGGVSRSSGGGSSSSSRGPSYNPSRGSSSSSSSGSSSRGPSYNPSRGSSSSSSSSSSPSRPSGSSSSSSSGTYVGGSSTRPATRPVGPRYDPTPSTGPSTGGSVSVPRGPRYNPTPSPVRIPTHMQAPGSILVRRTFTHVPRVTPHYPIRYAYPRDYYSHVNRRFIYRSWLQEPVAWHYYNGYWDIDGYPYYVHRSYRYRYSPVEMCQYELVDGNDYTVVTTFPVQACTTAYDTCAQQRDSMNGPISMERYFCAEKVDADLAQQPTEVFQPSAAELSEAQRAAINAFLDDMDFKDIFNEGRDSVGNCSIVKNGGLFSSGNQFECKYTVKVGDKAFPMTDESVCSDDNAAEAVGCNVGNEKENAGCILQQAIQAGLCL